jgi:hypothetical protein
LNESFLEGCEVLLGIELIQPVIGIMNRKNNETQIAGHEFPILEAFHETLRCFANGKVLRLP